MSESKFAIIKTGGKQYKVKKGDKLKIEKLSQKEGKDIKFKEILLYVDGKQINIGTPNVSGVSVVGKIMLHGKREKVIVFKKKKRKRYSKKKGHRQPFTEVEITEIKEGAKSTLTAKKTTENKTTKKTS